MRNKKRVFNFLNSQIHTVIGTVDEGGKPQGATVGFGQTEKMEIIFGTDKTTRKAKNIFNNPYVSFTFNGQNKTLQYEGIARLVDGKEREKISKIYFRKVPDAYKYYNLANQIYFLVTPIWLRFTDHTHQPGKVFEIEF